MAYSPLLTQPNFAWSIHGSVISSSCWLFEKNNIHLALALLSVETGHQMVENSEYKKACEAFRKAEAQFKLSEQIDYQWKWKLPNMNHYIMAPAWKIAQQEKMKCLQQLCTVSVGILNNSTDKILYTVSQRAVKHITISECLWPDETKLPLMHLSERLRYLYSSNILWANEKYGASIDTMQKWLTNFSVSSFSVFNEEFEKNPLLLQERKQTNTNVYFQKVEEDVELPGIASLVNAETDLPHPSLIRDS